MQSSATPPQPQPDARQYARFVPRFRGIVIDWGLTLLIVFGALFAAATVQSDSFSRPLGYAVATVVLLYEPVLVSVTGSTLGHYMANLRVVDDRHHGNVSFLKAVARMIIKLVLGLCSFVLMTATRRNQALHDTLTRSTVQIRDAAKARPGHYIAERTEFANPNLPSRKRRIAVILAYQFLAFVIPVLITAVLHVAGILSDACVDKNRCSAAERDINIVIGAIWLVCGGWIIGAGWRGKLPGARMRARS
jgi:uncharacterized RDD family membrane protein YckC